MFFARETARAAPDLLRYEKVRKNRLFDFRGSDLRDGIRGGPAGMQDKRQKLPDEQWQGLQLWQELRLLITTSKPRVMT
jgi:hypothetical protein